jgi:hypothetical protein
MLRCERAVAQSPGTAAAAREFAGPAESEIGERSDRAPAPPGAGCRRNEEARDTDVAGPDLEVEVGDQK